MKLIRAALFAALIVGGASPAWSQATRTWVSGVGDDVNPCSRTAPCKTFAGAISKTAAGGEINVIDPGGFGTVTITKSITIDGLGPMSSLLNVGANGVTINAAGAVVNLRNLTINGANSTTGNCIRIVAASEVNIDNVVCENQGGTGTNGRGVAIETSAAVEVNIQNSRFANVNGLGVHSNPSAGLVTLAVNNTTFVGGGTTAIELIQLTDATVNRVTVTGHNPGAGVTAQQSTVNTVITDSVFTDNAFGIFNGNGGAPTTRISNVVISRSTSAALQINGGFVISSGNNIIRGNAGNELPNSSETPR